MIALNRPASYRAASDLAGYFRPSLERRLRGNPNMSAAGRIAFQCSSARWRTTLASREKAREPSPRSVRRGGL